MTLKREASDLLRVLATSKPEARDAYKRELERVVRERLSVMPLEEVRTVAQGPLRLNAIKSSGIHTVGAAQSVGRSGLEAIRGVGSHTSTEVISAARHFTSVLREKTRIRIDIESRPVEQSNLLSKLRTLKVARRDIEPLRPRLEELCRIIDQKAAVARLECRRFLRFFAGQKRRAAAKAALKYLMELLRGPAARSLAEDMSTTRQHIANSRSGAMATWRHYAANPVVYNGLLIEIGGLDQEKKAEGFLPKEIVDKVRAFHLNQDLLKAKLRTYQSFGAKFALVQKRSILGDDMGLGKTVEALAVLCHLHNQRAKHFFVVCPASVLINWEKEIKKHTRLRPAWLLHGAGREQTRRRWEVQGGVAITTFGTLGSLDLSNVRLGATVVDEAHYIKNPGAQRTKAVRSLLAFSDHALLMTGTPMENRVDEFRSLVHHIRPDVASTITATDGISGATAFRKVVAPVYLRRNQEDVLDELPDKTEKEEWLTLQGRAETNYRKAVATGNFMTMRRAAFMTERPLDSPKLARLLEIANEALESGRKVVVFSFFRDVLARTRQELGDRAFEPLTGSVTSAARQALVDRFTRSPTPKVLVSQIEAGGVGLNIQAASVVILTEPQWKPSTEVQAIARCYRLGQTRPVQVHRLLTVNGVDVHMREVLSRKSALFSAYARKSAIKDAAPEAIDTSGRDRVSQAEHERLIIELERQRLGIEG